jgi:anti-sigma-K factor RskA
MSRYWHQSERAVEQLAAAYALGTLAGPARRRFEAAMREHPALSRAVAEWDERLQPMAQRLAPLPPSKTLWPRIEQRLFKAEAAAPWWKRWLSPLPAGALAVGLLMGLAMPTLWRAQTAVDESAPQLPQSYVGVLATADGKPGMIVSSLRRAMAVDLKQMVQVPVSEGQTLFLWTLDAKGAATPVGPVPQGAFVRAPLPQPAEDLFLKAVELGVTLEATGSTPTAPSAAYVYRGLCGKLWKRVP